MQACCGRRCRRRTTRWQVDTPIATDVPWWVVSLVLHVTLVVALAKILLPSPSDREVRLTAAPDEQVALEEPVPEVKFDEVLPEPVGETALDQFEFSETAVPLPALVVVTAPVLLV